MALIIILITLVIQRFLKFNSYSRQFDWATPYYQWMNSKVKQVTTGHGVIGLAILVVPIVLVAAIIFALADGIFGLIGAGILNLALVWYCLDGRDMVKEPYENANADTLLLNSYQHLFAVLFWYGLFGAVGLVLYMVVSQLPTVIPKLLPSEGETEEQPNRNVLYDYFVRLKGILDWVPVRLLGLSFALVGSFGEVFKLWMQKLFQGIKNPQALVLEWGKASLKTEPAEGTQLEPTIHLIDRSLLVWLVVIFLVTIGLFLG